MSVFVYSWILKGWLKMVCSRILVLVQRTRVTKIQLNAHHWFVFVCVFAIGMHTISIAGIIFPAFIKCNWMVLPKLSGSPLMLSIYKCLYRLLEDTIQRKSKPSLYLLSSLCCKITFRQRKTLCAIYSWSPYKFHVSFQNYFQQNLAKESPNKPGE